MKNRMGKLTVKLLFSFIGIVFGLMLLVSMVTLCYKDASQSTLLFAMHISFIIFCVLLIVLGSLVVHKVVLKRLTELNNALKQTSQGNYEVSIENKGNDEISELVDSFNKMTKELQANAFLSKNFARYVSHEFKTPLSVIRNYAELTQSAENKKDLAKNMDIIIEESDELAKLSRNLLTLCELDSTTIIRQDDQFSPAIQIRNIVIALQTSWEEKKLNMSLNLEEFEIQSNENLLYLVWQNLIVNAIKFSKEQGKIEINLKKADHKITFSIKDNGIGIKNEEKNFIYQPFFMGDKSHNKQGNGLGLTLTKEIVDKLKGSIALESEENNGAKFIIEIPV